jgi:4-amino-4-deoxy-L-arabinose transferase-like glycosyltransferase
MRDVASSAVVPLSIAPAREVGCFIERFFWPLFGAIVALMTFNGFFALETTHLRDFDEARYGVAASEMLHSHSPLVTTYAGATEYWNLKPPLGYWLLESSYVVFGETLFALRAPAAISGLLLVALTILFTKRVAGAGVGLLAGLILATCFGFLGHHAVRSGDLDAPLALILFPILFVAPRLAAERWAQLALGLILGLAFLLKSFAILPYVAATGIYCVATRGLSSWRLWVLPVSIAALIAITWAVARTVAEDSGVFVHRMVVEDLLQRSTSEVDAPGGSSLWDYAGCLFDRMAPWPLVIAAGWVLAVRGARQKWVAAHLLLVWCFALIPVLLFTIVRTHHNWYIVPTYPAWAILGAIYLTDLYKRTQSSEVGRLVLAGIAVIGLLAGEARVVSQMMVQGRVTEGEVFLESLGERSVPRGTRLDIAFTPSYSERFILQVVDGYVLNEVKSSPADQSSPEARYRLLVEQSQTYALARSTAGSTR